LIEDRDVNFIGGDFLDSPVKYDKYWMKKYFKTHIQYQFLKYYYSFNEIANFINHTGFFCSVRYLKKMKKKYKILERCHNYFKIKGDFENLSKLESGKLKISFLKKNYDIA
jgi:hypothetical protein